MKKLFLQFLLLSMAMLVHATQQTITLPANNGYSLVGCRVNGTGGNNINNTSFLQVPANFPSTHVQMLVWNCVGFNAYTYLNCSDSPDEQAGWYDISDNYAANVAWNPGEGMVLKNTSAASTSFTLNGTASIPVLPPTNGCGCGEWSLLSAQTNSSASTYQQVMGVAPVSGSEVSFIYSNTGPSAPDIYQNGSWTPATPILTNGQAAFFFVPCATNGCITILTTNLLVYAPCNSNCVTVPLAASAIDLCCSNYVSLQYYLGGTSISSTDTCFSVNTTNTVDVVAVDGCSNMASSSFTVAVIQETNPPVILSCPTNVIICTNSGVGGIGGPIIVDSDELALSDMGFSNEGDGALYATNCAAYLTRGLGKNILIYSSNSGLNNTTLYYSLVYGGYTVTLVTPPTPTLTESYLSAYNAVFVGGDPLTTTELSALAEYVCEGGGVYVAAGTGDIPVSNGNTPAQAEAAQWNYFLNPFGLNLADTYNNIQSVLTVGGGTLTATASPVMAGVNALDYSIGNDVSVIGGDPLAQVIAYDGTDGLIGVSGCVTSSGSGCGVMPDETGLVITSGGGTVTQSIPPGTTICTNTFVTFTVSNLCGEVTQTNIPCELINCASNGCITIESTNVVIYAPCGSNCVTVPLTAIAIDTCCSNGVSLQYYLGTTAISATETCFNVGTTNTVEVVAMDGCGKTATGTFDVTVLGETNCCCGPGLGPRTIQWLNLPLSTNFTDSVDLNNSTCGSWLITNLPCYGRVLITETAPGNITDFNNQGFQNVPNALGAFVNTDTNYGPYDWTYCPGLNFANTFTSSTNNLAWTLNFYFLDGPPNPCTLYLDASGLAQDTTATVSQPVIFRGEYDLSGSAHTCITNASYNPYAGVTGITNASTVGTVIGSYYNTDHYGDNFNTGMGLFQPTAPLPTTSLPQGSYVNCPGYPAAATVPYLSLNISQQPGDGIGFNIGYVCCGATCLNLQCPGSIVLTTCSNCATANFSASATDLCCSNVQITYALGGTLIDTNYCFPVNSTNTVETMAADSCGNFSSCSFTVTVLPGTNCLPCLQFNCPTNMTVQCGTLWTSTPPTIVHSCCPSNSIFRLSSVTNGTCPKYITDFWQVSDSCGDTDICTQQIAVVDTTAPVITGGTNPVTGIITTNCELVIPAISVTATDSCTPECSLGQWQSPTNGTIVPGPDAYVTVTVTDLCGNASQCQVLVEGVYKRGLQVTWPTQLISSNCLVPCVNPTFVDCSCPTDEIQVTQSPGCDSPIGPGQYRIHVTVKDCHGLIVETNIPLDVDATDSSFLSVLANTGIAANGSLLAACAVDPHYTLGPVPATSPGGCTLTGYTAPDALAVNNVWPWMESVPHVSEWISPNCELSEMLHSPYGFYTYTNRFVLPQGLIAASASISGRWAADNGGVIMFNGTATPNKITSNLNPDYWTPFTINANFLPYPQVNTVLFVVTNDWRTGCSSTGLRVEYLAANACSPCSPPAIISMTTPPNPLPNGGSYTFNLQADGTPPLTYQWLFNNNTIPGANSSSLRVNHITASSAGIYTVIVSDPCGSVTNSRRLSVVVPMPWTNGWWTFDEPTNPLTATFGPDLVMNDLDSGTNFSLSIGDTEDLGLPNPGGQIVNVLGLNPLWPGTLTLPPILPAGSTSNTDYTVIMDIYQPDTSVGTPSTLFESAGDGSGIALTLDVSNYMDITGTSARVPFDVTSAMPMSADSWHRVALVVTGPVAGIGGSVIGYLDGEPFNSEPLYPLNCPCCPLNINSAIYYLTNPPTILSGTNGDPGNGELYVSGVQFHTVALAPQIIAALSAPDSGPLPNISNVTPPAIAARLSASAANGTVNFTWQGGGYVLQETTDLTSGEWTDSELPFTETETAGGGISTTAVVNSSAGAPAKFYRLVFRP